MPTIGTRIIALAYMMSACTDHGPERGAMRAGARDEGCRRDRAFWSDFHRRGSQCNHAEHGRPQCQQLALLGHVELYQTRRLLIIPTRLRPVSRSRITPAG